MNLISQLENRTKSWDSRILQGEDKQWYFIDIYHTNNYNHGVRIEGTKEDMQKLVDMLNIAINYGEKKNELVI